MSEQPSQKEWQTSSAEEQGIDASKLNQMMDVIKALDLPVDSMVVVRHGQLVFEAYPNQDYGLDDLHLLF